MVALLKRLGLLSSPPPADPAPIVDCAGDLTPDQIAYLHELAEDRRRVWLEAKREP